MSCHSADMNCIYYGCTLGGAVLVIGASVYKGRNNIVALRCFTPEEQKVFDRCGVGLVCNILKALCSLCMKEMDTPMGSVTLSQPLLNSLELLICCCLNCMTLVNLD